MTKISFTLDWYGTQYTDDQDGSLNASVIGNAIQGFNNEDDDYIVLIPDASIEKSIYIQAHSPYGDDMIPVEIRFVEGETFKHYRYETKDKKEVYQIFIDYWAEAKVPIVDEWEDITDNL